ncbi:MAG TPA: 3-isopropylmalate dehydrogenase [Chloroflexota bacterium]
MALEVPWGSAPPPRKGETSLYNILVVAGDGIGPEVVQEGLKVLDAVSRRFGHKFNLTHDLVGGVAMDKYGVPLRPETLEMAKKSHAVLLGAVGDPRYDDPTAPHRPEDGALGLRKGLDVFANVRPVKLYDALLHTSSLRPEIVKGTDIVFVRELTAGTYFGQPKKMWEENGKLQAVDTTSYTQDEVERVLRFSFELARKRRKKLTVLDKANVMATGRLWRLLSDRMAPSYPDVTMEHYLSDAMAMALIRRPRDFDVIVADNLFGDILTDEAAQLAGSMGMLPSASLGHSKVGLYEPIHGSAPKYAGQNKVNPIATILSVALMLEHSLDLVREARLVERAVEKVLEAGYRTYDIAEPGREIVGTAQMGSAIADAVANIDEP